MRGGAEKSKTASMENSALNVNREVGWQVEEFVLFVVKMRLLKLLFV